MSRVPVPPLPSARRAATEPGAGVGIVGVRSPMVGRAAALVRLRAAVHRAREYSAPQLITVIGGQGTGKTRLIAELVATLDPAVRVFHGRAPTGPGVRGRGDVLASMLEHRFGLSPGLDDASARAKVMQVVREVMIGDQQGEVLHLLGGFVGLDFPASALLAVLAEAPEQKAAIARTVLRRFLELDAARSPLVLVFDDLQWASDDALDRLRELAAGLGGSPVVVLGATRPEMLVRCPTWAAGAVEHERIDLANLDLDDAEQMFRNLLARCPDVPEEVTQTAVEMTGGNPAFLEQLVRVFVANGALRVGPETWALDAARALATELPLSVEDAISARVAALARDELDLLEKASVFGNVFWISALVALTRLDGPAPAAGVAPLDHDWTDREPVRRRVFSLILSLAERDYLLLLDAADSTMPGDTEVVFKHNLERELIARATAPAAAARYCLTAAQWLEPKITARSDEQLEFLASLYERGGDHHDAARCYLAGGDRARARYAANEAQSLYGRCLELCGATEAPMRIEALHNVGDVLEQVGKLDDAQARFGEMLALAWRYDHAPKAGAAHRRLARLWRRQGRFDEAMAHLRRSHELFTRAADERGVAAALDDMGHVHWLRGGYAQALEFHRQALTLRRAVGDKRSIALSLANIGRVHHDAGNFKAAIAQVREALELRREAGDRLGVVQSLCDLVGLHLEEGALDRATDLIAEARATAGQIGDKLALAEVLARAGQVDGAAGRYAAAVEHLGRAKTMTSELGDRAGMASAHLRLAEIYLAANAPTEAEREAQVGVNLAEAVGSRVLVGAGYRVLAEAAMARGEAALAESGFRRAIDVLAAVKNEVALARTYRAFARYHDRFGQAAEAATLRRRADDVYARLRGASGTEPHA